MDSKKLGFIRFFRAFGNSKYTWKVLYKLSYLHNAPIIPFLRTPKITKR